MPDPEPGALHQRVADLLARMSQAWREGDFEFLRDLWAGTPEPLYLAEEEPGFARGCTALADYFARTQAALPEVRGDYRLEAVTPLAPPLHIASFMNEWAAREGPGEAMVAGTCRAVMVFEERPDRIVPLAYVEAPKAPLIYMRDLYRMVAEGRGFL